MLLFLINPFLHTTEAIDVSDRIFDGSWLGEVPNMEKLTPTSLWDAFFNSSLPIKTTLPKLREIQEKWTDEFLVSAFGNELVRTEPDRENRTTDYCGLVRLGQKIDCSKDDYDTTRQLNVYYRLSDFISNMTSLGSEFHRYIITMLPESMASELPFLSAFSCGYKRRFHPLDTPRHISAETQIAELNFWLSRGSTYSAIHYDMNQQIMCQIDGRKEWRFWDLRTELKNIPMWSGFYPDTMASDDTPIDPLNVDLEKYPDFINARWTNTTLNPGECLLIPSRHALHFVRSYPGERNIGFSVHVYREMDSRQFYNCDEAVANSTHSNLGDFEVLWPFPGDPRESKFNTVRMGQTDWKELSVYAIKRMHSERIELKQVLNELTNGLSDRSKRIAELVQDEEVLSNDLERIFRFGPLWREVYFLRSIYRK